MRVSAKVALAALVLAGSSMGAYADTLEQDFNPTIFLDSPGSATIDLGAIDPFNPALGTLDSVTLDLQIGGSGNGGGTFTVTDTADSDTYSVYGGISEQTSSTGSSASELADFENGPLDGSLSYSLTSVGILDNKGYPINLAGVIYTYTPAVTPEPPSLLMLSTGMLAGAGFLVSRRAVRR